MVNTLLARLFIDAILTLSRENANYVCNSNAIGNNIINAYSTVVHRFWAK